ncbi:MAG TPA: SDR family NAD(P)-dependent oxidoreductase, partial [Candidatus Izemoplasmatales bacterium]|nr:SDR family NAD(P)-dependent oxidoreductase [Candidatus Izemoplasmatales bacterium]
MKGIIMMTLKDKNIIITGASSGIGLSLTKQLLEEGANIFAISLDQIDMNNPHLHTYTCDLSKKDNIKASFKAAIKTMTSIDIYIANAGQARYGYSKDLKDAEQNFLFDLNVKAVMQALDLMKGQYPSQAFTFVTLSSAMAYWPLPGYASYAASKAAITNFMKAYRYELPKNQKLILVYPVATKTNFFKTSGQNHPAWMTQTPDHVGKVIVKGIKKGKKDIYPSFLFRIIH